MSLDDEFYKRWKTKSTINNRLLIEETEISKNKINQNDRIFSSTVLDQAETETFSLRLSESYIDETQESIDVKSNEKPKPDVIVIDSSDNESIFSCNKITKFINNQKIKVQTKKNPVVIESSDDESSTIQRSNIAIKVLEKYNSEPKLLNKQETRRKVLIEESDSEVESRVPELIKETVTESTTLSERKKKEILKWLSTNFESSGCGSSCSQDSIIADSRKSGISSGNSSLERLELNFETPNNRGKLSKPNTIDRSQKIYQYDKQKTLDQYFSKSKKGQLDIVKDRTPGSKSSDKTPLNNKKLNPKKLLGSGSCHIKTPESRNSDKTPVNKLKLTLGKTLITDLEYSGSKTPGSKKSDKTPLNKITLNSKNAAILDSESFEYDTPGSSSSNKTAVNKWNTHSRRIIIPESESIDSKTNESRNSGSTLSDRIRTNIQDVIIPESQSLESSGQTDFFEKLNNINFKDRNPINTISQKVSVESTSIITDDLSNSFPDLNLNTKGIQRQKELNEVDNITINTTINDCADILENLYGETWRNKVGSLICATEPKKQTTKKIVKDVQTEKKITFTKPILDHKLDKDLPTKKKNDTQTKKSQITSKIIRSKSKFKDSFIQDESSTESSPDCSYYTAVSNPVSSQNNRFRTDTASTIKASDKIKSKITAICDSESDSENINWKNREIYQRKLSFDSSSSSSTSEFDPEDVVPPKTITKVLKTKRPVNFQPTKTKVVSEIIKQNSKKSFLASLSKDVPLADADFKAMTYRVKYTSLKEELARVLYKLFNEKVFDKKLPEDMSIEWSTRLRGTAGKCYNKQSLKALGKTVRSSRIVLAIKVLDSPDRLRDTLIHEMCHAATWLIDNVSDGHGSFWKAWANRATKVFPELPNISRCHNYEIQTKYTYRCVTCGYSIGRHSKSLDLNGKRCGYCHGKFELLINKVTKAGRVQKKSTAQTKEPSGFALYVKENYHIVKQSGTASKHGEVMKILGQQFSAVKLTPKPGEQLRNNEDQSP